MISLSPLSVFCQQIDTSFSFTLNKAATTSAGIFKSDSILVRTLWSGVNYNAGTFKIKWDGTNDSGNIVPNGNYTAKVLSNNVNATWEGGKIGNTSDSSTGPTKYHGYENFKCMVIAGSKAYCGLGYTEGTSSELSFDLATPQKKNFILGDSKFSQLTNYVATDGTNVYWGGSDQATYTNNFVFATKISDNTEATFSSGAPYQCTKGRLYKSVLDQLNIAGADVSGMAYSSGYLFVSHAGLNQIHVFKVGDGSGALVQTITSFTSPRNMAADANANMWVISGTNEVSKYSVNSDGTLSSAMLSINTLIAPLAIAVTPDNSTVTVCDAGTKQQVRFFDNISAIEGLPLGQEGGYTNDPTVTDNKFYFSDQTPYPFSPFIVFQSDNSFWVYDHGNNRIQHYDANRSFIERIMYLPNFRTVQVVKNVTGNVQRVFASYQEFAVDLSKEMDNGQNGSWTLTKNWRAKITSDYYSYFGSDVIRSPVTLSNGRTYAILSNHTTNKPVLVELTNTGFRFTGIEFSAFNNVQLYPDGSLRQSGYNTSGNTFNAAWYKQLLTGFDGSNDPVWGNLVLLTSVTGDVTKDPAPYSAYTAPPVEITASNIIVSFNSSKPGAGGTAGYHLGGISVGDTSWLWKTASSTQSDYAGAFPSNGLLDIGNGSLYQGNIARVIDNVIVWGYNGEGWKGGETNKYNLVHESGLFVGQFGVVYSGEESQAQMAGNSFSWDIIKIAGVVYLFTCDESVHSGIHLWKITGLETVQVQSIPLSASFVRTSEQPVLQGINLMEGLPFDSILQNNTAGWIRSQVSENYTNYFSQYFSAKTNVKTYSKRKSPDLWVRYTDSLGSAPKIISRNLGANTNLSSWELSGKISYEDNIPNTGINLYLDILDNAGKILTRFYTTVERLNSPDNTISIHSNNTIIASGNDTQINPVILSFQPINIRMINGSITVKYAGFDPIVINAYDSTGNVRSPAIMRLYFENVSSITNYVKSISLDEMRFIPNAGIKYFQSKTSGNWNDISTWQSSADSTTWADADTIPSSSAETISILNGHTVNLTDTATVDQLVINKGGSLFITPNSTLKVNDGPDDDITIMPSGSMVILSDSTGTGKIGNSSGTIKGDVTVERYISSAKNSSYRLLAPSVNTLNSIKPFIRDNWQEGQNNTLLSNSNSVPTYGTQITGSADGSNGFDASATAFPTLYIFDQISDIQDWMPVLNTDTTNLEAKKGYLMFIQGDRSVDIYGTNSSNTTLRTTGSLLTGTQLYRNLESNGRISLITNPYASPINWNTVYNDITTDNATNFENYFIYWDPNVGTNGGYVSVQENGTSSASTNNSSLQIQSGQAFFVVTKAGISSPALTIKESHKSSNSSVDIFRSGSSENFMTSLYYNDSAGKRILADAVNAVFDNSFSNSIDENDAVEIANRNENIAILRSGKRLSIEGRSLILDADTLPLVIQNFKTRNYEWQFDPSDFNRPNLQASLVDKFLNNRTPISLTTGTTIPFAVTSNAESAAQNRFQVVFAPAQTLPVSITLVKAYQKETSIEVDWTAQNESDINKYEIEKSLNGSTFTMAGTVQAHNSLSFNYSWFDSNPQNGSNYYRIKTIDKSGSIKYTKIVNVKITSGNSSFNVYPNPITDNYTIVQFNNVTKGSFTLKLFNTNGQIILTQTINHLGGSASQLIHIGTHIPPGNYTLQITGNGMLFNKILLK